MASRSRTTFQKRQKEMKRLEKQRMKADRRMQRNMAKRAEKEVPGGLPGEFSSEVEIAPAEPPPQG